MKSYNLSYGSGKKRPASTTFGKMPDTSKFSTPKATSAHRDFATPARKANFGQMPDLSTFKKPNMLARTRNVQDYMTNADKNNRRTHHAPAVEHALNHMKHHGFAGHTAPRKKS